MSTVLTASFLSRQFDLTCVYFVEIGLGYMVTFPSLDTPWQLIMTTEYCGVPLWLTGGDTSRAT